VSTGLEGRVVSVRTGRVCVRPRPAWDHAAGEWATAYWKDEAPGPVHVGHLGLEGDQQADRRHHGGADMAVLMYAEGHYAQWRTHAGLEAMGPGGFGENLTVSGLDETTLCVGDVLEVGGTGLQVASPRGPCAHISRRWDAEWLLEAVLAARRSGWYLRVVREGPVARGDAVRLLERPHPGWTVERVMNVRYATPRPRAERDAAVALPALAAEWREKLARLAARD